MERLINIDNGRTGLRRAVRPAHPFPRAGRSARLCARPHLVHVELTVHADPPFRLATGGLEAAAADATLGARQSNELQGRPMASQSRTAAAPAPRTSTTP